MKLRAFIDNLDCLSKRLNLVNPLEINGSLMASLIVHAKTPLIINIRFDSDDQQVYITSPLSYSLPITPQGLQKMMTKMVSDLFSQNKKIGSLVAQPKEARLDLSKQLALDEKNPYLLAEFIPLFVEEAISWREKLAEALHQRENKSFLHEEEILNFNYPIS